MILSHSSHLDVRFPFFLWELKALVKAGGETQKPCHAFFIKLLANF